MEAGNGEDSEAEMTSIQGFGGEEDKTTGGDLQNYLDMALVVERERSFRTSVLAFSSSREKALE